MDETLKILAKMLPKDLREYTEIEAYVYIKMFSDRMTLRQISTRIGWNYTRTQRFMSLHDKKPEIRTKGWFKYESNMNRKRIESAEENQRLRGKKRIANESNMNRKRITFRMEEATLPASWQNNPKAVAAWELWCAHRRDIKKPLKERGCELLLTQWVGDPDGFAFAVKESIKNGWQGVFNKKGGAQQTKGELVRERNKQVLGDLFGDEDGQERDGESTIVDIGSVRNGDD